METTNIFMQRFFYSLNTIKEILPVRSQNLNNPNIINKISNSINKNSLNQTINKNSINETKNINKINSIEIINEVKI